MCSHNPIWKAAAAVFDTGHTAEPLFSLHYFWMQSVTFLLRFLMSRRAATISAAAESKQNATGAFSDTSARERQPRNLFDESAEQTP